MKEYSFRDINLTQFQTVDHLYDLLFKSKNISDFVESGLAWIVTSLKQTGGAIYLLNPSIEIAPAWIKFNIPEIWNSQLSNSESRLFKDTLQVYASQLPMEENPQLEISVMLPLVSHGKSLGVIILNGVSLTPEDVDFASILLYTFTRLILSELFAYSNWKEHRHSAILQTIDLPIKEMDSNPNLAILDLVKGIRNYFSAEYILFLQKDPETAELVIKNLINNEDDWVYQINQHISADFFKKITFPEKSDNEVHTLSINTSSIQEILDFPTIAVQSACYSPILSKIGRHLGSLILINLRNPLSPLEKEIFLQYSNLLANMLENLSSIQKLKITLAQMESRQLELSHSRKILREMFDNTFISIYIVDNSYTIVAINHARSSRLAVNPAQLVGKTCYEVLYGRTTPCPACRVSETLTQGKNTTRSWREWTSSETHSEWEISTTPIFDEAHNPINAIIQEMDITEKRSLEANLIQSEKLAAVGQLAAGVAHEINNPLSAIIANAQIQLQTMPDDDPDKVEAFKLIEAAGLRASRVVHNLLSISRKENQNFEPTNVNETIQSALLLIQHELLKQHIRIDTELYQQIPFVMAHEESLQGVWINLFLNAIDAITAAERPEGIINVKTSFTGSEIQVTIVDNGIGIDPEKVNKIFEPFYTTKTSGHGTGLGLSVCMRTIKEHQGSISVESKLGEGTRFTISIPVSAEGIPEI